MIAHTKSARLHSEETQQIGKVSAMDEEKQSGLSPHSNARLFEIHVKGHLDDGWSDWLGGLKVKRLDNGEMILSGALVDQAALMGILNHLHGLNLALLSVRQINPTDLH